MGHRGRGRGHYTVGVGEVKQGHPARCVVWVGGPGGVASALEAVLVRRGLSPLVVRSGHLALAELCVAQGAGERAALILCGVEGSERVLAAVERFAPLAVVWVYDEGANPPLRPVVEKKKTVPAEAPSVPARDVPAASARKGVDPLLRIVRENGLKPDRGPADAPERARAVSARDILDDAELEMLLAGERPREDGPR